MERAWVFLKRRSLDSDECCVRRSCDQYRPEPCQVGDCLRGGHPRCGYINVYTARGCNMATARVFRSGNSQAVRLPKQFRVRGAEVEIFRRGDEIVLREKGKG